MGRGFKKQLTATVDPATHDQVEYTRKRCGRSQSQYVAAAVDLQLKVDGEEVLVFSGDGIEDTKSFAEATCREQGVDFNPKAYFVTPDAAWQQQRIALDNCILARDHYGATLDNAVHDYLLVAKGLLSMFEALSPFEGDSEGIKALRRKIGEWEEGQWRKVPGIPEGPTTFAGSSAPNSPDFLWNHRQLP